MKDSDFLNAAIQLARQHMEAGHGGPFGAVIVHESRIIVLDEWQAKLDKVAY